MDNLRIKNKGFSLIEIVVSVSIFSILMIATTGIFKSVIEGQRSAITAQNTQESLRYALEVMSKEIRNAKSGNADCNAAVIALVPAYGAIDNPQKKIYNTASSTKVLFFKNKKNECVAYFLADYRLYILRDQPPYNNGDEIIQEITPDEIKISNLRFLVQDDLVGAFHAVQPRVTFRLDSELRAANALHKQPMKVQTTISSRNYE